MQVCKGWCKVCRHLGFTSLTPPCFTSLHTHQNGLNAWGALQAFLHLVVGWPAYLLIGATGGPARGLTNHLMPDPLTEVDPKFPGKELFPGKWKTKVLER